MALTRSSTGLSIQKKGGVKARFLRTFKFRSRKKLKPVLDNEPTGPDFTVTLPDRILRRILSYVCPHTMDTRYKTIEESLVGNGCPLCDTRDLAHAIRTCRRWHQQGKEVFYSNIRIDIVHYCPLEEELSKKRKRTSRFEHNGDPYDPALKRLQFLQRTLYEDAELAETVLSLKISRTTRESYVAELARIVSRTRNLKFLDCPDGVYGRALGCSALREELKAQCQNLRQMKFHAGSEPIFYELKNNKVWMNLEVIDLNMLAVDARTLLDVLPRWTMLRDLSLKRLNCLQEKAVNVVRDLPPVQNLRIENCPGVTLEGLAAYLRFPQKRLALQRIQLIETGVGVGDLHQILAAAENLRAFTIELEVKQPLEHESLPDLASYSVTSVDFQITSPEVKKWETPASQSHYDYLIRSLNNNSIPNVDSIWVRDVSFQENFLHAAALKSPLQQQPTGTNGHTHSNSQSNTNPFANNNLLSPSSYTNTGSTSDSASPQSPTFPPANKRITLYAKGNQELDYHYSLMHPALPDGGRSTSTTDPRPFSINTAPLGPVWGGEARRSMIIGNGQGGFLAIPDENGKASAGARPTSRGSIAGGGAHAGGGFMGYATNGDRPTSAASSLAPPTAGWATGGGSGSRPSTSDGSGKRSSRIDLWR